MQLYSYWVRATLDCLDANGYSYHLVAYAGSDTSLTDAQQQAAQLLQNRQARLLDDAPLGAYPTGAVPLREQLIRRVYDLQGQVLGAHYP